jgi:hypothetical protein
LRSKERHELIAYSLLKEATATEFKKSLRGQLLVAGDSGYDEARKLLIGSPGGGGVSEGVGGRARKLRQLCGWSWERKALEQLPSLLVP